MSDQSVYSWFASRSLRLIGLFLVFASAGMLVFLVLLDIIADLANPYLGIITYLILPVLLVVGLLLVPLDAWLRRRRVAAGRPDYPSVDLNDPHVRKVTGFFLLSGAVIIIILTVVTYKAVEFMDTDVFCGRVCHRVMDPEYTAFKRSAHASVGCSSCHIGPGAPWFVRSKLSGVPQVYHYLTNTYEKPIPTPVAALRPSRDTCENCHWPEEFYGNTLRTTISYNSDVDNTQTVTTQVLKVGSGGVPGAGIHSHMTIDIYYLPATENRSSIAWTGIRQKDGSYIEYVNPAFSKIATPERIKRESRLMGCIDCHNRAAHDFLPFETLLDMEITRRNIPQDLPYIKREVLSAVGEVSPEVSDRQYNQTLDRIDSIENFYQERYPDLYKSQNLKIKQAVSQVKRVYRAAVFPLMNVGPDTYPNWRTHAGCFRCHGVLVPKGEGQPISQDCDLCHSQPVEGSPVTAVP